MELDLVPWKVEKLLDNLINLQFFIIKLLNLLYLLII